MDVLDTEARAWIDTEPCKSIDEPDPEPPPQTLLNGYAARRVRIHRIELAPLRLSILIGDCLFNLRSCLDHLALALAVAHTPAISDDRIRDSEFPVFSDPAKYRKQRDTKIGCVAPSAQSVIEQLQPYHRGNAYGGHPLWQIHELNRIDKHRRLTVCAGFPIDDGQWTLKRVNVAEFAYVLPNNIVIDYRRPEVNAVLARWAGKPIDKNREMRMDLTAPIELSIGEGVLAAQSIVPCLKGLCDFVGNGVINPLSKFL